MSAVTLFTIGNYASTVRNELAALAAGGHEIASHGPDHGRLPNEAKGLGEWLRRGRETLEDLVQRPVRGFRSPRFDIPPAVGLSRFRGLLVEAGFDYVSDTSCLGPTSPISELPVLRRRPPAGHRRGQLPALLAVDSGALLDRTRDRTGGLLLPLL